MFSLAKLTLLSSVLVLLASAQVGPTSIVLKDEKRIDGQIQGNVALFAPEMGYVLVDGKDVLRIDESGARVKGGARGTWCLVERSVAALQVLEEMAADETSRIIEANGLRLTMFNNKGTAITPLGRAEFAGELLGEFRVVSGKGNLANVLRVTTEGRAVQLRLDEIIPYKAKK